MIATKNVATSMDRIVVLRCRCCVRAVLMTIQGTTRANGVLNQAVAA